MKTATAFLCLIALVLITYPFTSVAGENAPPVIVELFTSEACSSCPPADALLTKLRQKHVVNGAEILALSEHVDYFNHSGWTDRFSSSLFTERQNAYAKRFHLSGPYTPQIVIDGRLEAVGSDEAAVEKQISLAAHSPKMASVSLNWSAQNTLHVTVANASREPSAVLLAITEDGLTTSVGGGENGGRILRHSGVVRELRQLGFTSGGTFSATETIVPKDSWKRVDLQIVVFVQKSRGVEIVGAAALGLRPETRPRADAGRLP
jgi:hypothetical protein